MSALGAYAFGTIRPLAVANVASSLINGLRASGALGELSDRGLLVNVDTLLTGPSGDAKKFGGGGSLIPTTGAVAVVGIGAVVLALLALRFAAGWYVGKQFQRPVSGTIVGGIFGAPGLGVLSFFPGD